MRQAGYVPKNHDSGVYWVRASGGASKDVQHMQSIEEKVAYWLTLILLLGGSFILILALLFSGIF